MGNIPRPEHPFPQFVREDWVNLNGTWDFELDLNNSGLEEALEKGRILKTRSWCPSALKVN